MMENNGVYGTADLQAQASCTTWLETAAAHQKTQPATRTTTEKYQLVRLVSNAISNTRKDMAAVRQAKEPVRYWCKTSGLSNTNNHGTV